MGIGKRAIATFFCICLVALIAATAPVRAEKKIALVIGNSAYEAVAQLENPKNDSSDVASALERLGFKVTLKHDLNYEEMRRTLREFSRESVSAQRALLFYAGHGIEVEGTNYLIPVDAQLRNDLDVQFEAIPLDSGLSAVEGANELRMVLLDACRNNPFINKIKSTSGTRSIGRGLARVEPAVGTLVAFAAKEGTTADDGEGRNSPFTAALLNNLEKPGLELNFLFRNVRDEVYQSTRGRQQPFTYGSLPSKQIFLKPEQPSMQPQQTAKADTAAQAVQKASSAPSGQLAAELLYWNTVKDSNDPDILQSYLNDYPGGKFAGLAKVLIAKLRASAPQATAPSEPAAVNADTAASQNAAARKASVEQEPVKTAALAPDTRVDDRAAISEVQAKLFELNYDPGPADGLMGSRTVQAIRDFEKENGLKVAGTLTLGVLDAIRQKAVPDRWGALGFATASRTIVEITGASSRRDAERRLKSKCGSCGEVLTFSGSNCAAISLSSNGWGWAVRKTSGSAQGAANEMCGKYGSGCEIKASACAGQGG